MADKYLLQRRGESDWKEVSKQEWIKAERQAGFYPKVSSLHPQFWLICATGGFNDGNIRGRIEFEKNDIDV